MHRPTKIDYAKLLGFDLVSDELVEGVDFNNPTVGAKLGRNRVYDDENRAAYAYGPAVGCCAGAPIMQGLGGRKVAST